MQSAAGPSGGHTGGSCCERRPGSVCGAGTDRYRAVAGGRSDRNRAAAGPERAAESTVVEPARAAGKRIQQQYALDLTDSLNNNFSGININQSLGQPVPAGCRLPRLYLLAAAGHLGGPVGLPGRCTHQRVTGRHRQLRSDSAVGDLQHHPHLRLQSGVRPQHAGRGAGDPDQEWPRTSRQ